MYPKRLSRWEKTKRYFNEILFGPDVRSFNEEDFFQILVKLGFPQVKTNFEIEKNLRLDFYYPDKKLCFEIDGEYHYLDGGDDNFRDAYLFDRYGVTTIRFTSKQLKKHPDLIANLVHGALRRDDIFFLTFRSIITNILNIEEVTDYASTVRPRRKN